MKGDMGMARGTIRRVLEHRGFGFIQCETGREVFFHRSQVVNNAFEALREGQPVEFMITETPQGPKALRVRAISEGRTTPLEAKG